MAIPLTPLTAVVRTLNVPNVSYSSQELALVALCFLRADFLSARFPRRFFRVNVLRLLLIPGVSYPGSCLLFSDVLGAAIPPRLDFFIVDSVAYSRSRGGGVPTLLPQARLQRETISLCWGSSPPVDAVGSLAPSASPSSRINRCHEGTLIHARTL